MPSYLRAEHLCVRIGVRTLFDIDHLEINPGDRIGLVGVNGAGKSTLLHTLLGEREPDGGFVWRLAQAALIRQLGEDTGAAQRDTESSIDALAAEARSRLHAETDEHPGISGGEMARLRMARALAANAPLLFCDEPTANLDMGGVAEVRRALLAWRGAYVLVSHDRALLDDLCEIIWALENGALRVYPGNYSAYLAQSERDRARQRFEYDQYRTEQERLRGAITDIKESSRQVKKAPSRMGNSEARLHKRGKGTAAKKRLSQAASALESRLENLGAKERPVENAPIRMGIGGRETIVSATAVRVERLTLEAGGRILLRDASLTLPTGSRTALIGPNGSGKTTLMRAIRDGANGVMLNPGVSIGWFGQETVDTLDLNRTLLENACDGSVIRQHEVRTILSRMGLTAADVDKRASVLSGGERAKAALARLMAGDSTLLMLDEPGNHLDAAALAALEEMLSTCGTTLLLVTHDRRMIERVSQRLLIIENGTLRVFEGTWEEYEREKSKSPATDEAISEDILRMRMSALAARIAAPKKGDNADALDAEYNTLVARLRMLRGK